MTRRLTLFLLFLLFAGLLAPAQVKAGTMNYYGLSFDGSSYVEAPNFNLENFTVILIGDIHWTRNWQCFFNKGTHGVWFGVAGVSTRNLYLLIGDGTAWKQAHTYYTSTVFDRVTMIGARWNGETSSIIVNGKVVSNKTYTGTSFTVGDDSVVRIGDQHYSNAYPSNGTIYEVLVYNRALSDSEIQAIYADPLNPPTSGLVLFYAPDSVDTANNVWTDKSGNGNDGSIVGATYVPLRPLIESEPSKDTPVALRFNGDDYVDVPWNISIKDFTIVAIARVTQNSAWDMIASAKVASASKSAFDFVIKSYGQLYLLVGNESGWQYGAYTGNTQKGDWHIYATSYIDGTGATFYFDGQVKAIATISLPGQLGSAVQSSFLRIGAQANPTAYFFNGTISYVLFYTRALSDSEIRQIYENPNNPPKDGLVLWYSPYTYDPASGKWLNRAPIFPTIPLVEELDGTNYGATPERVSIPSASYYDIENNSEIPVENVSVAMTHNNTTIGLIPSFLTLPWNQTVTLNVSAVGYESRTLSILTTINSLAVYLIPAPSNGTTTSPPNWTNNFTMPDINGTWSGWQIGKEALSLNFDKAIQMFFTENPNSQAQAFLPFAIWIGMTILGLVFSQSPLVALTLGVITQASLAGLGAKVDMRLLPGVVTLYLFLFIWILKDFIESRKAD